ncbi:MAG: zinc ribbon domain-containing protein [Planctomycetota bacterium]
MPLYEYHCDDHGTFAEFASVADCEKPQPCPDCGAEARRAITIPRLTAMPKQTRIAHERNEKSRVEPHVCGPGCGHNHGKKKPNLDRDGQPVLEPVRGPRPWVVEHA